MTRLTVDLEPLANLYHDGAEMVKSVVKNGLACEIGGADSVMMGMGKDSDQRRRKAISLLIDSLDISLSVRTPLDDRAIEALQDLKPGMVVFPHHHERKDTMASAITSLQVENILAAMEIPLEVDNVKEAAKLKCDYVILDCSSYCAARTINAQLDELNKIVKIVGLCNRLSIGAIAHGNFTPNHISKISAGVQIEEYLLGLPFISNSLIHGYAKAIQDLRFALS